MTDEDIKKLAALYVSQNRISESEAYYENRRNIEADDVLPIMQWLSDRFCIVPKSKAREKYSLCKMGYTECEGLELGFVMDALEDIFGKSLFEEDAK